MSAVHIYETPTDFRGISRLVAPSAPAQDTLGVDGVRMAYARNEEIFGEGEPADYVYRVLSGAVRTYKILNDGRRQIGEFYLPGDVFGLEAAPDHCLSAEAVGDATIFAMKRRPLFAKAAVDCETAQKLWALSLHDLQRMQDHMLLLGRKSALERLAWFLIDMAERIPAERDVILPMSRQDIADFLGLTIETVSRTMTQLQDDALISLRGCRHVVLRDRAALKDITAA
jgi:CRP/FNR family transcriptional regulator, nitrogen fixation regulation protein